MTSLVRRRLSAALMALGPLALTRLAAAQESSGRVVRLVVPYPAGGPTDVIARALADRLTGALGQAVVVENRPGANTIVAAVNVINSPPDGQTLLMTNDSTYSINPLLYSKLPYNPQRDLMPIVAIAHLPECLIINPIVPVKTLQEFIAYAKANPGKLNYGSFGPGSSPHLAAEGFKAATGVDIVHVPFKGGADLLQSLLRGEVQIMFASPNAILQYLRQGKLLALATYAPKRIPQLPDVPTYDEEGLHGLDMNTWFGVFAPGRTPDTVVQKLADQIDKIVGDPVFRDQRLTPYTFVPATRGRAYFQQVLKDDVDRYKRLVQAADVKLD